MILSQPNERTANPNSNITLGLGKARCFTLSTTRVYAGVTSHIKISDLPIFVNMALGMSGAPVEPLESSRSSILIDSSLKADIILSLI